ncbi:MAG: ComF family protein [Clostridia bacterium]|nr:ComF family protein [Clostridia bacterium]
MNIIRFFGKLFFPEICCVCGEIKGSALKDRKTCFNSGKNMIESPFCEDCTRRMEESFYKARPDLRKTQSPSVYLFGFSSETVSRAIYHLKTHNCAACRRFFARLSGEVMKDMLSGIEGEFFLTNIPRSVSLLDKYGFDQSEEVLRTFVRFNDSFSYQKLLERDKRYKAPQRLLNAQERLINARRSLKLVDNAEVPKKVIVLDDMITTGATAITARNLLISGGASDVRFLFLAGAENFKERRTKNE